MILFDECICLTSKWNVLTESPLEKVNVDIQGLHIHASRWFCKVIYVIVHFTNQVDYAGIKEGSYPAVVIRGGNPVTVHEPAHICGSLINEPNTS